jgi:dihydropteroate synthase
MSFIPFQLNINGDLLDLSTPIVMGVVNITPDSFYSGSRKQTEKEILDYVEKAVSDGAKIIDIGAYSTRPSAEFISEEEEKVRLSKALQRITNNFPEVIISLDTFRANVAKWGVEKYNVKIINDISGGNLDKNMFETVAKLNVPYILMHTRGTPQTMQSLTDYDNLLADLIEYFQQKIDSLSQLGVKDIIIDPGFGFAKTLEQNYELVAKMNYFTELGFPILFGVSRKSMIYNLLHTTSDKALHGTTALNMLGLLNGASILRVHDVEPAIETIKIFEQFQRFSQ